MNRKNLALLLLGVMFVVSGLSALIVEQVFEKLLLTVVGAATHSGAIVLGVFFVGLSIGGLLYRRLRRAALHPLLLFGAIELTVAISGCALAVWFSRVQELSSTWLHVAGNQPVLVFLARLSISAVWMGLPTIAMGATFPAVLRLLEFIRGKEGGTLPSVFYALNLLGAVSAGALGPYWFFPRWGLAATLGGVCAVQALICLLCVRVCWGLLPPQPAHEREAPSLTFRSIARPTWWLMAGAALSGFLVFSLEVIWYDLIGAVLGMSAYAFATMLSVVLLALFLGSAVVSVVPRRLAGHPHAFGVALLLTGIGLALTQGEWPHTPADLNEHGYWITEFATGEWLRFRLALLLVGIPSLCAGTLYPLLLRAPALEVPEKDQLVAFLGVSNTLGCVLGSLVTAFGLLGALGAERSLHLLLVCAALSALGVLVALRRQRARGFAFLVLLGLALSSFPSFAAEWDRLALTSGYHVYFRPHHVRRDSRLVFWHEDAESGFVTVVQRPIDSTEVRTLLTNGKFQGNDGAETIAQTGLGVLPCLATSGRDRALVVGLGTGQSARVVSDAGFRELDIAEISRGIVVAAEAEFGGINGGVLQRPNVHLFLEDARNHLLRTTARYDLISMEISSIWFAGATNLYSEEYYRLTAQRLLPGGVLQQWIQLHHITEREVLGVLKSARDAFLHVELWYIGGQGIILASDLPIVVDEKRGSSSATAPPAFREHLRRINESSLVAGGLRTRRVLDAAAVTALQADASVPTNTDANRWLEYATPRHAFLQRSSDTLVLSLLTRLRGGEREESTHRLFPSLFKNPP